MYNYVQMHYQQTIAFNMFKKIVVFLALVVCQALASGVEVVPAAPVVAARSSQYFAQNHNALAAPLVEAVAPVAQYIAPSAASVSQFTRYAQYIAPAVASYVAPAAPVVAPAARIVAPAVASYVAPAAPIVAPAARIVAPAVASYVAPTAPLVAAQATPLVARASPLVTRPVVASLVARGPLAQPVAPVAPQQPAANPAFQTPNPDSESVEVESARLRALPQARNQPAQPTAAQAAPAVPRFQHFPSFSPARYQEQINQNQRTAGSQEVSQPQQQQQPLARNQAPEQQRSAAPGFVSSQPLAPAPYLG